VVTGNAKALALIDIGDTGWPSFVVTRNNSTSLLFRNGGVAGCKPLKIVLRGRPGNPTAVGARVTVAFADGASQTTEVYAGSGYYSQSTASCFFVFTESNPAVYVRVRWPSGAISQSDAPRQSPILRIFAPPLAAF
jgi:hypothetical protein